MLGVRCENGLEDTDRALQNRHEFPLGLGWELCYGLPATQTSGGRLASIIYIMIGIPLFLIILAEVGKLLSRGLRKLYKKMHKMKRIPEAARKMSEPMKAIYHMTTSLASTAVGPLALQILNANNEEEKLEAKRKAEIKALAKASKGEKKSFPIPWALTILIVWILFSAALFCIWESEWGYINSVYFFFVSISTVGLGDLVPTKPDMMEALQKLIERLIEQYIDEIEKIAAVVTNNEINEFTEELEPFNVGEINEISSLPIATLNIEQPRIVVENGGGIGRTVKDWFAEKAKPVKAKITVHKHSLDENKIVEDENLPQIEIHEGTPLRIEEMPKNQIKFGKTLINKGIINERTSTLDSTPTREGISSQKRHKKPPKLPKDYAGALLKFSAPTMQAIRAIENSRLKNGQIGNDFKSRLFARLSANQRLAEIVENNAPPPKKMVSSSIQTSPRQSPIHSIPQKSWRLRRLGCGIESLDSTSSDLNVTRTTTNDASNPSCSANDLDSLYSNTYFDVCF
uniref:Potassium channel domain-containing protein n=1 Tax=Meloidogyne javanica TaxID=6303 RepID=A0A915MAZ8_MELJA